MDHCAGQLQRNSEAVAWLQAERGLNAETISRAGLGWNDRDLYQARTAWGLQPEMNQQTGRDKKVWLPGPSLVIPMTDDAGQVIRLRIRCSKPPKDGSRYIVCSGSGMQPLTFWDNQAAVAVVESELDALLLSQEVGELKGKRES